MAAKPSHLSLVNLMEETVTKSCSIESKNKSIPKRGQAFMVYKEEVEAAREKLFRAMVMEGVRFQLMSSEDHSSIVNLLLDKIDDGIKPSVIQELIAYGVVNGKDPVWAKAVLPRKYEKKMAKLLPTLQEHSSMQDLKEGNMMDQTHKAALQQSTLSGMVRIVHSGSQLVRDVKKLKERVTKLEKALPTIQQELDLTDSWQEQAVILRRANKTIPEISRALNVPERTLSRYYRNHHMTTADGGTGSNIPYK